jgi:hypothetical protein
MYYGRTNYGMISTCYQNEKIKPSVGKTLSISLPLLINAICEAGHAVIDLLKIDVEGAEYKIFSKRDEAFGLLLHQVRFITIEPHAPNENYFDPQWLRSLGYDPENPQAKLKRMLQEYGFGAVKESEVGQLYSFNKIIGE